jgi:hypothetical protein
MEYECLESWVGLSEIECTCFDTPPEDFNTSKSGLFLTQLTSLKKIEGLESCENDGELWTLLSNARRDAIIEILNEVGKESSKNYGPRRIPFNGTIGEGTYQADLNATRTYAGVRIKAPKIKGGVLRITKIGVLQKTTGTFFIHIYNSNNELLQSIELESQAYIHKLNTVDIELPLSYDYSERNEYFMIFTAGSVQALRNKLKCNCDSYKFTFDETKPYYDVWTRNMYSWANWIMLSGYQTNSLTEFNDPNGVLQGSLPGLTFECQIGCTLGGLLCQENMQLDTNIVAKSLAFCIWYKAGMLVIKQLLTSDKINRLTLVKSDDLAADIEEWGKQYKSNLDYVIQNINYLSDECFHCKESRNLKVVGAIA